MRFVTIIIAITITTTAIITNINTTTTTTITTTITLTTTITTVLLQLLLLSPLIKNFGRICVLSRGCFMFERDVYWFPASRVAACVAFLEHKKHYLLAHLIICCIYVNYYVICMRTTKKKGNSCIRSLAVTNIDVAVRSITLMEGGRRFLF